MQKVCYGRRFNKLADCLGCELHRHCSEAGDPSLVSYLPVFDCIPDQEAEDLAGAEDSIQEDQTYSHDELLNALQGLMSLTGPKWELFRQRLLNPGVTLQTIGDKAGCSRQYVQRMFDSIAKNYPSLTRLLTPRKTKKLLKKQPC